MIFLKTLAKNHRIAKTIIIKDLVLDSISNMISLMCKEYNTGPSTAPCRTSDARQSSLI